MDEAWKEAETVIIGVIDEVLKKTGVKASDIGILVVNSSVFSPVPSLSSMVVNHFKLREDILSFNLGGMGCSAGLISIGLAQQLLQVNILGEYISYLSRDTSFFINYCHMYRCTGTHMP